LNEKVFVAEEKCAVASVKTTINLHRSSKSFSRFFVPSLM